MMDAGRTVSSNWARKRANPSYMAKRKIWAERRRRARGVKPRAEYLSEATLSPEIRLENRRRSARLAPCRNTPRTNKPVNRERQMPHYTRRVIAERRQEYIKWWKSVVPWQHNAQQRKQHMARIAMMAASAARRREYISWWRRTLYERDVQSWRRQTNLKEKARKVIHQAIKKKTGRKLKWVGCSSIDLRRHLESQFRDSWNWGNYGKVWNIDHLIPLSKFDLKNPDHWKLACHYTNLRPLAAWANARKSDRIIKKAAQPFLPLPLHPAIHLNQNQAIRTSSVVDTSQKPRR